MNLNLSQFNMGFAIGSLASLTSLLSVGLLGRYMGLSVPLQPEPSQEQEEQEMKKWSSQLQDPSHKDFNPFLWNHTPDEFANKK